MEDEDEYYDDYYDGYYYEEEKGYSTPKVNTKPKSRKFENK